MGRNEGEAWAERVSQHSLAGSYFPATIGTRLEGVRLECMPGPERRVARAAHVFVAVALTEDMPLRGNHLFGIVAFGRVTTLRVGARRGRVAF